MNVPFDLFFEDMTLQWKIPFETFCVLQLHNLIYIFEKCHDESDLSKHADFKIHRKIVFQQWASCIYVGMKGKSDILSKIAFWKLSFKLNETT